MINRVYLSYVQAVSLGTYGNKEELYERLNSTGKPRWPIEHHEQKECLLKGLRLLQEGKNLTGEQGESLTFIERQTLWGNSVFNVRCEVIERFVTKEEKTIAALIQELENEIQWDKEEEQQLKNVQAELLEAFRAGTPLFGRPSKGRTHEPIPAEIFISETLNFCLIANSVFEDGEFDSCFNSGNYWIDLKLKSSDLPFATKLSSYTKVSTISPDMPWQTKRERDHFLKIEYQKANGPSGKAKAEIIFEKYKSVLADGVSGGKAIKTAAAVYRICAARK